MFREFETVKYYIYTELRILRVIFAQTHKAQTGFFSSEATFDSSCGTQFFTQDQITSKCDRNTFIIPRIKIV